MNLLCSFSFLNIDFQQVCMAAELQMKIKFKICLVFLKKLAYLINQRKGNNNMFKNI